MDRSAWELCELLHAAAGIKGDKAYKWEQGVGWYRLEAAVSCNKFSNLSQFGSTHNGEL